MLASFRVERFAAIGDSLDIICPFYESGIDPLKAEQSIIYRVSEHDYQTCMLSSSARELGRCISPMKRDKVKVSFRLISPNPSALDYSPGRTYYFISTSTGTVFGLSNRYGGLCASHNLKMIIHVTEKNGDTSGHAHQNYKIPSITTYNAMKATNERWQWDPLWAEFFEKVGRHGESTIWSTVSRGERLTLDSDNRRHEYNALSLRDEVDFQIHEIGDKDDLFSSGCCPEILVTVISICVFVFKS